MEKEREVTTEDQIKDLGNLEVIEVDEGLDDVSGGGSTGPTFNNNCPCGGVDPS